MVLRQEWEALLSKVDSPSIFLTWEWMVSWLETVFRETELFILTVRDSRGNLVALAPFYQTIFTLFSCLRYKTLRFVGDCHSGAEYPDILIIPGLESAVLKEISNYLFQNTNYWDCAWLPNIGTWSESHHRLAGCFEPTKLLFSRMSERTFSHIVLPATYEEYLQRLSRNRRSLLGRQERAVLRKSSIDISICETSEELDEHLEQLFCLHKKRWQWVGQEGAFVRRPLMKNFYRKMALRALENGWLALFSLHMDGVVVASQYGYVYNNVFSQLQEGFEPQAPAGIGNILRKHVIRWCIENKIQEYDFLGGYSEHKKRWLAEKRSGCHLFLGRKCIKNLFFALLPIQPSGRYVNQGIPAILGSSHG